MNEPTLDELKAQLAQAREDLADRQASLPAHSLRPSQIQELEELEDLVRDLEGQIKSRAG